MKLAAFNARCPFEIGDKVQETPETGGKVRTITDIACTHYVKSGEVRFLYELDNNGRYVSIQPLRGLECIGISVLLK